MHALNKPNMDVVCVHDKVKPAPKLVARVSHHCWDLIVARFPQAVPLHAEDLDCAECRSSDSSRREADEKEDEARRSEWEDPQRSSLKALLRDKGGVDHGFPKEQCAAPPCGSALAPGRYRVLPRDWVQKWRGYVGAVGAAAHHQKRRPGPLPSAALTCNCDKQLVLLPTHVADWVTKGDSADRPLLRGFTQASDASARRADFEFVTDHQVSQVVRQLLIAHKAVWLSRLLRTATHRPPLPPLAPSPAVLRIEGNLPHGAD
jgi:hypothetical protein